MTTDPDAPWPLLPVANTPIPADANADLTRWFSIEMCLAHNIMLRALNALWRNAPLVAAGDARAFAGYGLACLEMIRTHHHAEEAVFFPRLQRKLDMGHNVAQHEAFHAPMDALQEYFARVNAGKEVHDGEMTRYLLKAFADPLLLHLTEEIDTISPEKLSVFTQGELTEINKALQDHIKGLGGFFVIFPFALTAHDKTHAPHWPPVPNAIKWFAINIGYFVNWSYWKFSPYSRLGEPQTYSP